MQLVKETIPGKQEKFAVLQKGMSHFMGLLIMVLPKKYVLKINVNQPKRIGKKYSLLNCNCPLSIEIFQDLVASIIRGVVILLPESRKGLKKVTENWKKNKKVLRKTGKNICVGNRKMPFLSHRNPEKLENMTETRKHNLKFAETGKIILEAAESPKRQ